MKKLVKVIGVITLMIFSFYYTEKVALFVQDKSPLKQEIYAFKEKSSYDSMDAIITNNYIIPGLNGLTIDVNKSFKKMTKLNTFDESLIVYKTIKPELSIKDNIDKIIISGNLFKNEISIIVNKGENEVYLNKMNINYSYIDDNKYCINNFTKNCDNKFKIKTTKNLSETNFLKEFENIRAGDILYLSESISEKYLDMLLKRCIFLNLQIVNLNNLITE